MGVYHFPVFGVALGSDVLFELFHPRLTFFPVIVVSEALKEVRRGLTPLDRTYS